MPLQLRAGRLREWPYPCAARMGVGGYLRISARASGILKEGETERFVILRVPDRIGVKTRARALRSAGEIVVIGAESPRMNEESCSCMGFLV